MSSPDRGCGWRARRAGRRARPSRAPGSGSRAHAETVACVEPAGEREQRVGLARVELDLLPVLVHEPQRAGHATDGTSCRSLGPPCRPLGCWLVRAITIIDGRIEVARAARPRAAPTTGGRAGARRRPQPGRPAPARRATTPRRPARRPTSRAWSSRRRRGGRPARATASRSAPACSASPAAARRPSTSRSPPRSARPCPTASISSRWAARPRRSSPRTTRSSPRRGLQPGEWVLVHAVGSGVGTAALQLATALGARVVGTARTPSKLDRCRALGLDARRSCRRVTDGALDVDALAWAIVEATDGGAHVTIDLVGGHYVEADVARGRAAGPHRAGRHDRRRPRDAADPRRSWRKRLTIIGTVLRGAQRRREGRRDRRRSSATSCRCSPTAASRRSSRPCIPLDRVGRRLRRSSRPTRRSARSSSTAARRVATATRT